MEKKDEKLHKLAEGDTLFSIPSLVKALKKQDALKKTQKQIIRIFVDDNEQKKFNDHLSKNFNDNGLSFLPLPAVLLQLIFEYDPYSPYCLAIFFKSMQFFIQPKEEAQSLAHANKNNLFPISIIQEFQAATADSKSPMEMIKTDLDGFAHSQSLNIRILAQKLNDSLYYDSDYKRLLELARALQRPRNFDDAQQSFINERELELFLYKVPANTQLYRLNFIAFMTSFTLHYSNQKESEPAPADLNINELFLHTKLIASKRQDEKRYPSLTYEEFITSCPPIKRSEDTLPLAQQSAKNLQLLTKIIEYAPRVNEVSYGFHLSAQDTGIAKLLYNYIDSLFKRQDKDKAEAKIKAENILKNFPLLPTQSDPVIRSSDGSYRVSANRSQYLNMTRKVLLLKVIEGYKPKQSFFGFWGITMSEKVQKELRKKILASSLTTPEEIAKFNLGQIPSIFSVYSDLAEVKNKSFSDRSKECRPVAEDKPFAEMFKKLKLEMETILETSQPKPCLIENSSLELT